MQRRRAWLIKLSDSWRVRFELTKRTAETGVEKFEENASEGWKSSYDIILSCGCITWSMMLVLGQKKSLRTRAEITGKKVDENCLQHHMIIIVLIFWPASHLTIYSKVVNIFLYVIDFTYIISTLLPSKYSYVYFTAMHVSFPKAASRRTQEGSTVRIQAYQS